MLKNQNLFLPKTPHKSVFNFLLINGSNNCYNIMVKNIGYGLKAVKVLKNWFRGPGFKFREDDSSKCMFSQ